MSQCIGPLGYADGWTVWTCGQMYPTGGWGCAICKGWHPYTIKQCDKTWADPKVAPKKRDDRGR